MIRYTTFDRRFVAGIIDGFVLMPIGIADAWLLAPERGPVVILAWSVLSHNAYLLYSVVLHWRKGQTVGKMLTGITVLDVSEARLPTLRQALLRDSFPIAMTLAYL